jgi:hypothetical protein
MPRRVIFSSIIKCARAPVLRIDCKAKQLDNVGFKASNKTQKMCSLKLHNKTNGLWRGVQKLRIMKSKAN